MRDLRPDLRIALSLAGIAAVTVPASAPVAIAAAAAAAPAASGWDELAGVTLGPEYLDSAVESLLNAAVSELAKRDELVELEKDYPGLLDAFRDGLRPVMQAEVARAIPEYRASLVGLYSANLTAAEATEAARFMRGPAMTRFRAQVDKNRTLSATVGDIAADRDVTASSLESDMRRSTRAALAQLSPADVSAINRFYRSPLGTKITALDASKTANRLNFLNRASPENQQRAETAVNEAMLAHIAKTDPAMAAALRSQMQRDTTPGD